MYVQYNIKNAKKIGQECCIKKIANYKRNVGVNKKNPATCLRKVGVKPGMACTLLPCCTVRDVLRPAADILCKNGV
jgi:hypothetical protein